MSTIFSDLAQAVKPWVFYLHFTIFKTQVITKFQHNYYDAFSCVTTALQFTLYTIGRTHNYSLSW